MILKENNFISLSVEAEKRFYMGFNKEKLQLDTMLQSITHVNTYTDQNFEVLNETYNEFRKIVLTLYKKHTNIFGNLYNYELKEIKDNKKKILLESDHTDRQPHFIVYRDSIENAVERTINYIAEYTQ